MPKVDPLHICDIVHLLGGHNTWLTANIEPRLKVIVTSCGRSPTNKAMTFAGCHSISEDSRGSGTQPVLACDATPDEDFDVSGVRDCLAAAKPLCRLPGQPEHLQANYPHAPPQFPGGNSPAGRRVPWPAPALEPTPSRRLDRYCLGQLSRISAAILLTPSTTLVIPHSFTRSPGFRSSTSTTLSRSTETIGYGMTFRSDVPSRY
jgi:hypothetical protein